MAVSRSIKPHGYWPDGVARCAQRRPLPPLHFEHRLQVIDGYAAGRRSPVKNYPVNLYRHIGQGGERLARDPMVPDIHFSIRAPDRCASIRMPTSTP